eukprot:SAG31_NODE_6075_length_2177_cov_1.352546_2_plen_81_part_00
MYCDVRQTGPVRQSWTTESEALPHERQSDHSNMDRWSCTLTKTEAGFQVMIRGDCIIVGFGEIDRLHLAKYRAYTRSSNP